MMKNKMFITFGQVHTHRVNGKTMNKNMVRKANKYRAEYNRIGGIVLFFNDEIYGWKNELRNPECEQPGVVAIDDCGNQWEARGGDCIKGAERWEQIWNAA